MSLLPPVEERKRLGVLRLVVAAFVLLFVVHLLDLQVVNAEAINKVSKERRGVDRVVEAVRGTIYDKDMNVLAKSIYRYDVNVNPSKIGPVERKVNGATVTISVDQAATRLADLLDLDKDAVLRKFSGTGTYANLAKKVNSTVMASIESLDLPWLWFDTYTSRSYPNGAVAGNLLGFITSDGTTKSGIERQMDKCLAGVDGQESYERGADGIRIPESAVVARSSVDGGALKLTIDSNLQYFSQQALEAQLRSERGDYGVAIVVEIKTGRLLVAAEAPSLDPNNPGGVSVRDREAKIFTASYEPGSTMKMITAAIAIDQGVATPSSRVIAPDKVEMPWGSDWVKDAWKHEPLKLTLAGVLRDSSNTGIIQFGERTERSIRFQYLKKFGFGSKTSIKYPGESAGILGDPKTWDLLTDVSSMFGQGIAVSPIQMAYSYQAIANKGVRLAPVLYESCTSAFGEVTTYETGSPVQVVSEKTSAATLGMLEKVIEQGSAGRLATIPGYRVAGKSGTAQIKQGSSYGNLYAISFAGIAPADDPRFAVLAMIYKSRKTATSRGVIPVFKEIMQQTLRAYRVPPSGTKSEDIPTEWK